MHMILHQRGRYVVLLDCEAYNGYRSLFIIARTSEGVSIEHSPYSFEQGHGVHLICAPVSRVGTCLYR